ncbi:MAG: type I-C CRISPR-associated protein Cas8c/Csd1 [Hyphomicrobiales bacterium]|nr:MAG: type I-C CRISPR-associated protein Cas8c/Csd1 [Hyphomicrobiales bacterium]
MSVLASLVRAYERMKDAPPFGYSAEKIGFLISLMEDGTIANVTDLREGEGKRKVPKILFVPQPVTRTSNAAANFLWDNSSYVLGVTAREGMQISQKHSCFVRFHLDALKGEPDAGLSALRLFLERWSPDKFDSLNAPEMMDQNIVFTLESDRLAHICIHDRPAARVLWARLGATSDQPTSACLVTGEHARVARLHPAIKGVWGAQPSGARLVSFNLDAFNSYGHEQGDNAPVSEAATFAYTTALNRLLERDSGHRIQIGDASTVFWADASSVRASEAEGLFAALLGAVDETAEARKITAILDALRQGRSIDTLTPDLPQNVRFFVLGLSPNVARLSARFYIESDFDEIATRYLQHVERIRIEPPPREAAPSLWRMLIETASQRKSENISPLLAGEWLRAILTGAPYPLTLLATILMRLRADHDVNALRVAMLKSVLVRNFRLEAPVALDPENDDPGYLLGRLFATYEYAQTQALGGNVNATIRDQYYGTASATPRSVFPILQRKATHHLSKLRKGKPGLAVSLDRKIGEICELARADSLFPPTLNPRRQALFAVGYYHQRNDFYRAREGTQKIEE